MNSEEISRDLSGILQLGFVVDIQLSLSELQLRLPKHHRCGGVADMASKTQPYFSKNAYCINCSKSQWRI